MADQYTCILSKNVMTGKGPTPLHALVVCNSETGKIHQIIELDSKKKDFNSMIEGYKKKYKVVDVGNHFVLPGVSFFLGALIKGALCQQISNLLMTGLN